LEKRSLGLNFGLIPIELKTQKEKKKKKKEKEEDIQELIKWAVISWSSKYQKVNNSLAGSTTKV
jgi:hypothetical protein